jgi:hypothetical protein
MMQDAQTSPSTSTWRSWRQGDVTLITSRFVVPIDGLRASTILSGSQAAYPPKLIKPHYGLVGNESLTTCRAEGESLRS